MYFQINFLKKNNRWYIIILSNTLYSKKKKKVYRKFMIEKLSWQHFTFKKTFPCLG